MIDDAFFVRKQKWGTWVSYDLGEKPLITSYDEESCVAATRWYLKGLQDQWANDNSVKYEGSVGGKL